ncbi:MULTISPECIES: glycosyltransferase [Dethiosulfovibrio]|uniref:Glycosyltransferase n=2 Tax=Dethiosulfovibrio TaxID=47054 RepID=A0ABS9ENC5_9BACT|nr:MULTISPECIES: glycosyltransferase [Dethiosulfovibrio]MCF4113145.1 glycosyltransferase [Dethiosulfovibrio russensis]MCF4142209.1 glycosyltransferase [Dethiosulfovibrio marinus]MCF4144517.1 glycosyltransferase [Dethiosulfovibrio acidaminovorans]
MKRVVVLTSSFPYLPGEQFLEDEMPYWGNKVSSDLEVFLMPFHVSDYPRSVPDGIKIDLSMSKKTTVIEKAYFLMKSFFCKIFYQELCYLFRSKKLTFVTVFVALRSVAIVLYAKRALDLFFCKHGIIDVAYCYWNDVQAYASVLNKRSAKIKKIVSRAHGFDLYEERRRRRYMPLKRQFLKDLDIIYAISQEGKKYMEDVYGVPSDIIMISRLGVPVTSGIAQSSPNGYLNIVSVSSCSSIKRIDKIIEALSLFSSWHDNLKIRWSHIGEGPLLNDLKILSKEVLSDKNIEYKFWGFLPNNQVKSFFLAEPVDLFINSSESEGVPVSIMEAMACGVPAIAPNIGGISELIPSEFDTMLPGSFESTELALLIERLLVKFKEEELRFAFKKQVIRKFEASENYVNFVNSVLSII